ncbi:MAG: hypothetical protein ACLUOI_17990 [Eisenbergiella sp.]
MEEGDNTVAALAATLSVTVTAAVNYVRQRMEAMNEAERTSHFQASLNTAPADFYSRELTDMEKENGRAEGEIL